MPLVSAAISASLLSLAFGLATMFLFRSSLGVALIVYAVAGGAAASLARRSTAVARRRGALRFITTGALATLADRVLARFFSAVPRLSISGVARSTATAASFSMPRRRSGATAAVADAPSSGRAAA